MYESNTSKEFHVGLHIEGKAFDPIFIYNIIRFYWLSLIIPLVILAYVTRNFIPGRDYSLILLSPETYILEVIIIAYMIIPLLYFLESITSSKKKKFKVLLRTFVLFALSIVTSILIIYLYFYSLMVGIFNHNLYGAGVSIVTLWIIVFFIYHILGRFFRLATPLRDILVPNERNKNKFTSIPEKVLDSIDDYIIEKINDSLSQNKLPKEFHVKDSEYLENSLNNMKKTVDFQRNELIQIKSDLIKQKLKRNKSNINSNLLSDPDPTFNPDYSSYSHDQMLQLLFDKFHWFKVALFYYFYLGFSILVLLGLSLLFDHSLFPIFNYLIVISFIVAIGYGIYQYYHDKIDNHQLLRNLNLYRTLIYLGIAVFHVYFINTLDNIAYNSNNYNFLIIFLAVWSIPLFAYGTYYWYNELKTKEQRTLLKLNRQPLAFKLAKFYLTSHLPSLKSSMVGVNPLTVDKQFKNILSEDLLSLEESLQENGIQVNSREGLLMFVMKVIEPLRTNLRELLGEEYSKILIQAENNEELSTININEVWDSLNKSFLRWDSST